MVIVSGVLLRTVSEVDSGNNAFSDVISVDDIGFGAGFALFCCDIEFRHIVRASCACSVLRIEDRSALWAGKALFLRQVIQGFCLRALFATIVDKQRRSDGASFTCVGLRIVES